MESIQYEIRRIFGFLFICVAAAVAIASVTSEILFLNQLPSYLYGVVWLGTFGIIFSFYFEFCVAGACAQLKTKDSTLKTTDRVSLQ